ncbi:hypothetical protein F1188_16400 [Roseospira marina]|uniref:Uncharacterized protein n=1 Tax=Roseospira marina TaxID=140057 RepID=A0A5M6I9T2_9PROT|nr:hypothetical protein [Roseospira marina]KAA5604438.1 hypothetical protein F1188_16400 [Roseospira marina]MBB4315489.1 hypothetical protein [Roseospira marina]MBB5089448.1 hypothetical protein [Roseospira marina]
MAKDTWDLSELRPESPATHGVTVAPNDVADLAFVSRALYIGGQGDVTVTMLGGETMTLKAIQGWAPLRVTRVMASGTTATHIVAVW